MGTPPPHPIILLIEDSDEDYVAFARSIDRTGLKLTLHRCRDGDEALEFLFLRGRHANPSTAPRPSLILLDLNLPGTDGREVLARVKQDERLRAIPIIVLTSSTNPRDVSECYEQGANGYQVKSVDYEHFSRDVQRTVDYWFGTAVIPTPAA